MADVRKLKPFILKWEGGFVNDPDDLGGATNKGVTIGARDYCYTPAGEDSPFQNNTNRVNLMYNNVNGYAETQWMLNTYSGPTLSNTYSAFFHASRYGTTEGGIVQYAAPPIVPVGLFRVWVSGGIFWRIWVEYL